MQDFTSFAGLICVRICESANDQKCVWVRKKNSLYQPNYCSAKPL